MTPRTQEATTAEIGEQATPKGLDSLPLHLRAAVIRGLTGQGNGISFEQALSFTTKPVSKPSDHSGTEIPRHLEMSGMTREQALKCMGY